MTPLGGPKTITTRTALCYLYDAQCVVQFLADFFCLLLFLFFAPGRVLVAVVVNTEAEEDLHAAEVVVEVAETHLIETWRDAEVTIYCKGTLYAVCVCVCVTNQCGKMQCNLKG